jgi:Transcription factor WhiB
VNWQTRAACKNRTELFFPAPRERAEAQAIRVRNAFAVCDECCVRDDCLQAAERIKAAGLEVHGIWGGRDFGW